MNRTAGPRSGKPAFGTLDWSVERQFWPHADTSRFVLAGGLRWHVQQMGEGPPLLLIHGTGAATHSWRGLAPLLARQFTVIAPDLPGHGFTERGPGKSLSLPAMAAAIAALVDTLDLRPRVVIGHSAGVAILIRCCLDGTLDPDALISINGALIPFRGTAGYLFPPLAKLLFVNPLMPRFLARSAGNRERLVRLIRNTGSQLDETGIDLYGRLFTNPAHVAATLGMMASWDLHRFVRDLPALKAPLLLIVGDNDQAIAPADAERIRRMVPTARIAHLADLGHLAHEEDAVAVADLILDFCADHGRSNGRYGDAGEEPDVNDG